MPQDDPVDVYVLMLVSLAPFPEGIIWHLDPDAFPVEEHLVLLHRELVVALQNEVHVQNELKGALHFLPELHD